MNNMKVKAFRFDEDLIRELRRAARADGRVLSSLVRALLRGALEAREREGGR